MTDQTERVQGSRALKLLTENMAASVLGHEESFGAITVFVAPEAIVEAATLLRDDPEGLYIFPVHVTAVDWPDREPELPRFDVVYQLRSFAHNDTVRLVVRVSEADPTVSTLENVFAGMDWHEREAYDLLGINFAGHHDLQRILLPNDWVGHPLRKDYVSFGEPVAFTHNLEWALPAQERPADMPGGSR